MLRLDLITVAFAVMLVVWCLLQHRNVLQVQEEAEDRLE